jgi:hypothetical protein
MQNVAQTELSQFAQSPCLATLVDLVNQHFDPSQNIGNFYDFVWNLTTAKGWGLDVLGRIVGVQRVLQISAGEYLGFEQMGNPPANPFNQAPFFDGEPTTSNYALSDDAFRLLIAAKAAANICDGSIPAVNAILLALFPGRGDCYVVDNEDMTLDYHFTFTLQPFELAILTETDVLPRATGVTATVVHP